MQTYNNVNIRDVESNAGAKIGHGEQDKNRVFEHRKVEHLLQGAFVNITARFWVFVIAVGEILARLSYRRWWLGCNQRHNLGQIVV